MALSKDEINVNLFDEVKRLELENKALKMDKENMWHIATRANFTHADWEDFDRIYKKKNHGGAGV